MESQERPIITTNEEHRRYFGVNKYCYEELFVSNYCVFIVKQSKHSPHEIYVTKPDYSCERFYEVSKASEFVDMSRFAFAKLLEEFKFIDFLVRVNDLKSRFDVPLYMFRPGDIVEFTIVKESNGGGKVAVKVWNITRNRSKRFESIGQAEFFLGVYKGWISEQREQYNDNPFVMKTTTSSKFEPYDGPLPEVAPGIAAIDFEEETSEKSNDKLYNIFNAKFEDKALRPSYFSEDRRRLLENGLPNRKQVFCFYKRPSV